MKRRLLNIATSIFTGSIIMLAAVSCQDPGDEIFDEVEKLEQEQESEDEEEKKSKPGKNVSQASMLFSPSLQKA